MEIGSCTFSTCTALKNIVIPQSVESIDDWAFIGCENLQWVVIKGTPKFGKNIFEECKKIEYLIAPKLPLSKINQKKAVQGLFEFLTRPSEDLQYDEKIKDGYRKYFHKQGDLFYREIAKDEELLHLTLDAELILPEGVEPLLQAATRSRT